MTARWLTDLAGALDGRLLLPGSDGYTRSTTPRNAVGHQAPVAVAVVTGAGDVSACVRAAAGAGVRVAVQATGHGAGGDLDAATLLVDTSALDRVEVDPTARVARVGAGATFGAVNGVAWRFGLLGLAGTAPDVGAAGYTFGGGVGWLTRPHGLAAATLRAVDWVDGQGRVRRADETRDTDALWAFRGGGGVGIATAVELSLVPAADLWAGFLLWPAEQLAVVAAAWAAATGRFDRALSTSVGLLGQVPDAPGIPDSLRGRPAVHLCAASTAGARAGAALQDALDGLPSAVVDTRARCDADRLSMIHLDPPVPVPALGEGRWLTDRAAEHAVEILTAAGAADSALAEIELRHLAAGPDGAGLTPVSGARTSCPGSFLLHATGAAADPDATGRVEKDLARTRDAALVADTGRAASAFCDGRSTAPDAFDRPTRERLAAIRATVDPAGIIRPARSLT